MKDDFPDWRERLSSKVGIDEDSLYDVVTVVNKSGAHNHETESGHVGNALTSGNFGDFIIRLLHSMFFLVVF